MMIRVHLKKNFFAETIVGGNGKTATSSCRYFRSL